MIKRLLIFKDLDKWRLEVKDGEDDFSFFEYGSFIDLMKGIGSIYGLKLMSISSLCVKEFVSELIIYIARGGKTYGLF